MRSLSADTLPASRWKEQCQRGSKSGTAKPPSITANARQPNGHGKLPPLIAAPGRGERRGVAGTGLLLPPCPPPPQAWEGLGQFPSLPVSGIQLSGILDTSCPSLAHFANEETEAQRALATWLNPAGQRRDSWKRPLPHRWDMMWPQGPRPDPETQPLVSAPGARGWETP